MYNINNILPDRLLRFASACHLSLESLSIPAAHTDGVTVTDVADFVDENESNPNSSIEQAFPLSNDSE